MIAVIDYGVGNLFSLISSLKAVGADAVVTSDAEIIKKAEGAEIDLEAQIEKLAARYKGKSTGDLYKDRAKCMRFLMNRGYPLQLCDKILTKGDFFK